MKKIPRFRTIIVLLVLLVTLAFLLRTIYQHFQQAQQDIYLISPIKLVASFSLFLGYFYMRALSFGSIVLSLKSQLKRFDSLSIWFFSEATRYIPGNAWSFISRAYLARRKNLSWNSSILILPIEITAVLITTSLLSIYSITKTIERIPSNLIVNIILAILLVLLVGLFIIHKRIGKTFKKLSEQTFNPKDLLISLVFQLIGWSMYGIGTTILLNNFTSGNILLLFSSSLLAWLIGYLSIITPMGLGVRESAFVFLTSPEIGITQAVLIAVLHRLILTSAELTNLAFWVSLKRKFMI